MAAYLIVQRKIADQAQFQKYIEAVGPLIAKIGGKAVVRGGATVEALEGHHDGRGLVILEFPSMEAIHGWWNWPEYVPMKKLRLGAATLDIWAVQGV